MNGLAGIKARLGSIAPIRAYTAGGAIERIIKHDMPKLIAAVEAAQSVLSEEGVKEYLSAYVMGVELINRVDKLGETK